MPVNPVNLQITRVYATGPVGTPGGVRVSAPSPVRGRLIEAGFCPSSLVTSQVTMAVAVNAANISSAASSFTQCITSTLGTFSSTNLYEGATASAVPPSPTFVNIGDAIQWTCSGGQTSLVVGTLYADIIRA